MRLWWAAVFAVLLGLPGIAKVLPVGPGLPLTVPSQAAAVAQDGDVVEIAAGVYKGDTATWRANNLTLRGVRGRAVLDADGKSAGGKAIWVIAGKNTTVEHIEFRGCRVPDKNGAGIRQEGAGLTARDCAFLANEDGILSGANPESDILLEYCEFGDNGHGDGYSHNLYIGRVRSLTMQFCYSHGAKTGHLLKSRAENNFILYNRLTDEATGNSSYVVDIPNGGKTILLGNILQHGAKAENRVILSYAAEGAKNAVQELYLASNTFVSRRQPGDFFRIAGTPTVVMVNNLFTGNGALPPPYAALPGNVLTQAPGFVDAAKYDFHLTDASPARGIGVDPGKAGDYSLTPKYQYAHPCGKVDRPAGKLNVGAY